MTRINKELKNIILENWYASKEKPKLIKHVVTLNVALAERFKLHFAGNFDFYETHKDDTRYFGFSDSFQLGYRTSDLINDVGGLTNWNNIPASSKYAQRNGYSISTDLLIDDKIDPEVRKAIRAFNAKVASYNARRDAISSILDSVTTIKKLLDVTPSISRFIPETAKDGTALISLDTISIAEKALAE